MLVRPDMRVRTHAHICAHIEKTEIELEENEQNYEVMWLAWPIVA